MVGRNRELSEAEELTYVRGERAVWARLLSECLRNLGYDTAEVQGPRSARSVAFFLAKHHAENTAIPVVLRQAHGMQRRYAPRLPFSTLRKRAKYFPLEVR